MIKEVISIDMNPKTPACEVIVEWAEETAKYFDVPFVLDASSGDLVYKIYRDMHNDVMQLGNWRHCLKNRLLKSCCSREKTCQMFSPDLAD